MFLDASICQLMAIPAPEIQRVHGKVELRSPSSAICERTTEPPTQSAGDGLGGFQGERQLYRPPLALAYRDILKRQFTKKPQTALQRFVRPSKTLAPRQNIRSVAFDR